MKTEAIKPTFLYKWDHGDDLIPGSVEPVRLYACETCDDSMANLLTGGQLTHHAKTIHGSDTFFIRQESRVTTDITEHPVTDAYTLPEGETRTTSSTGGQKGVKDQRYSLLPVEALAEVTELYNFGTQKYAAHNWRKGYEFSKSYDSLMRHANAFWGGENIDPETGKSHLAGVVFHALALMTFVKEHPEFDDRFSTLMRELPEGATVLHQTLSATTFDPPIRFDEKSADE